MSETSNFLFWHFSKRQVTLIRYEGRLTADRRVLRQLLDPASGALETFCRRHIETKQGPVCPLIMMRGERLKPFLTCGVPEHDLHFVWTVLKHDLAGAKLDCNCCSQSLRRHRIFHIAMNKGCLADARFAHKHYLDHLAELFNRLIGIAHLRWWQLLLQLLLKMMLRLMILMRRCCEQLRVGELRLLRGGAGLVL